MKSLGKFPDPFIAEIAGQPDALRRAAAGLAGHLESLEALAARPARALVFAGMGSSYDACYPAVTALARAGIAATMVDTAELLHFRMPTLGANDDLILALAANAAPPWWQLATFRLALPVARGYMLRAMAIDDRTVAASKDVVRRTFDRIGDLLRDGRRYLLGDRMSVADLTFAALGAPMVGPAEHPFPVPTEHASDAVLATWREMRAHPAGAFVLRLYADHRR